MRGARPEFRRTLGNLLASRGVLAAAWIVVLAALAGAMVLALLQPPPPPHGEPLTIAIALPEAPPAYSDTGAAAVAPPEDPSEAAPADTTAAESAEAEPNATTEPPATVQPPEESDAATQEVPAAVAALPRPKPQTTNPEALGPEAPENRPATAAEPEAEVVAAIPAIPPAIEQLSYWELYRQPFNMDDKRPRIAVVLSGLGLSDSATEAAIEQLPAAVTLSFSPYARDLERWIALARARGHEVMLDLPMEPATFPNEDPGPQGLLTSLSPEANLDRLDWVLSRGSAYVGLAGSMGSRFTASREALEPILREVGNRGLMFLDRRTTEETLVAAISGEIGLPHAVNSRSVDERQASRVAIDARLAQIERIALTEGFAVAMAQPYPVTLERLAEWATELTSRGFALAPISALADRQNRP
jgi:uncharacterized protein